MTSGGHDAFSTPGAVVGRYHIVRRLAVGGMGELMLAHTRSMHGFEKFVVLKRILPQHATNPDFVRMFLDEARLAATLDHPNIAHVYDIGEFRGSYFFSMEYVHGQSLMSVMRAVSSVRRPLPLEHALNIVIGTCAGLHHAHEKRGLDGRPLGIVHRDISPPNIILTYDGGVKVVDFGIAKAATAESSGRVRNVKGKVPYMSPEQCLGQPLDRRSDIFSIGILLYELTVGRRLFRASDDVSAVQQITSGRFPRPTQVHRAYPRDLEAAVMSALQLDRQDRFATARDLQIALEEFAREYKLAISSARLAAFMEELFDEEARCWPTSPEPTGGRTRAPGGSPVAELPTPFPGSRSRTAGSYDASNTTPQLGRPFPTGKYAEARAAGVPVRRAHRSGKVRHGTPQRSSKLSLLERGAPRAPVDLMEEARTRTHEPVDPGPIDTLRIDLDDLELEDLDPRKFAKPPYRGS